jgi:NAD(P)-dependent dehydrogenase (short-subunit alcohol dehydrogenase family)
MSSRVGSIADNSTGDSYAYRASKAALNSIGKSMAMDLREKGVLIVLMHRGYVKTGLDTSGRTHQMKEAVELEEAAGKLWKLPQSKGLEETGRFLHREVYELEW